MINAKKITVIILKQLDLGSAIAVRLTKITGKSKVPIHPKHFLTQTPWFTKYIKKSDIVLDLGCGNGQNSAKAAKFARKIIGVDFNESLLSLAKKSSGSKNISFKKINLEKLLPFKDSSFDKILFLDVLEHLKNRNQIMKEIRRVLKRKGLLFLGVPNSQSSWKKLQRSVGINSFSDPDHKIEFSDKSIKDFLKKHKFEIINFGWGKYDTPLRGVADVIGGFSISLYKKISDWRFQKAQNNPKEASGFEIITQKI